MLTRYRLGGTLPQRLGRVAFSSELKDPEFLAQGEYKRTFPFKSPNKTPDPVPYASREFGDPRNILTEGDPSIIFNKIKEIDRREIRYLPDAPLPPGLKEQTGEVKVTNAKGNRPATGFQASNYAYKKRVAMMRNEYKAGFDERTKQTNRILQKEWNTVLKSVATRNIEYEKKKAITRERMAKQAAERAEYEAKDKAERTARRDAIEGQKKAERKYQLEYLRTERLATHNWYQNLDESINSDLFTIRNEKAPVGYWPTLPSQGTDIAHEVRQYWNRVPRIMVGK